MLQALALGEKVGTLPEMLIYWLGARGPSSAMTLFGLS
jgi:hypothetical protein